MEETASPATQTHYDVLQISPEDSQDRIHRAYRSLLEEFRASPSPELDARIRRARIAYQVLSDPRSRALYNSELNLPEAPQRRWEKHYLQEEEERLMFWTGAASFAIVAFLGFFWQYLVLKVLLWLPRALYRAVESLIVRKRPAGQAPHR